MLDGERLDAVHICTPHHLHPAMVAEATRRGLAAFTEKPPAIDAEGWERVLRAAEQAPVGVYLRKGDVPALLYASNGYSQDAPVLLELHFDRAVVRLEGDVMTVIQDGKKQEIPCETDPVIGRSYWGAGHKACIADFYRCIAEGTAYANRPACCDDTLRTMLRLYDSAGVRP